MKISGDMARLLLELYSEGDATTDWEDEWFEGNPRINFRLVHAELIDTTRWSHVHERVYWDLDADKCWRTTYRTGATECQDETPYEYEKEVELEEVVPTEVTVVKYEVVK